MVKAPPWQHHSLAPAPPQGAPGGSGQLGTLRAAARHIRGRDQATGAKPLPRVLEQTASKVTDVTASDHLGDGGRLPHVQRGRLLRSEDTAGDQSRVRRWYGAAPLLAG